MTIEAMQIDKAVEVAGKSVEAAQYLPVQFEKQLAKLKNLEPIVLESAQILLDSLKEYAKSVGDKLNPDPRAWFGTAGDRSNRFEAFQSNLALQSAGELQEHAQGVEFTMAIAVSDRAEVLRAYIDTEEPSITAENTGPEATDSQGLAR